jgi:hypothetical protein
MTRSPDPTGLLLAVLTADLQTQATFQMAMRRSWRVAPSATDDRGGRPAYPALAMVVGRVRRAVGYRENVVLSSRCQSDKLRGCLVTIPVTGSKIRFSTAASYPRATIVMSQVLFRSGYQKRVDRVDWVAQQARTLAPIAIRRLPAKESRPEANKTGSPGKLEAEDAQRQNRQRGGIGHEQRPTVGAAEPLWRAGGI